MPNVGIALDGRSDECRHMVTTAPGTTTLATDQQIEREKWARECDNRERELAIKERELKIREDELAAKHDQLKRSFFTNPLTIALFGATIAALANVGVALYNGRSEQKLEEQRAEDERIVGAVNGEDPDTASGKLRFLVDTHLITDESTRSSIMEYIQNRLGGEGVGVVSTDQSANVPPAPQSTQSSAAPTRPAPQSTQSPAAPTPRAPTLVVSGNKVTVESEWLSGGHSQHEVCESLRAKAVVEAKHRGKSVKLADTNEHVRRHLGQVTYKYGCEFILF
jgi:hypothetical protein